jgi:hypothetical protein
MKLPLLSIVVCTFLGPTAQAADWHPLKGTYAITASSPLDSAEGEPKDSHLRIQLEGRAARDLYRAMKGREVKDECTGGQMRRAGEMRCVRHARPERYECDFSIDLLRQRIEYGVPC